MSRYDGLIIPRSYNEYINKTDAATLQQALQLPGVLSGAVAAGDNKAVKSSAVNKTLESYAQGKQIILPMNANLNDYKDRGEYLAINDTIGNSIQNRPNQAENIYGFSMSVHNSGNDVGTQIIFCSFGIYVRRYVKRVGKLEWSNWKTVINY